MEGQLDRRGTARIWNRNDDVDVVLRHLPQYLARQLNAHAQACLVDINIIDDRVGPRQVNILEDAGIELGRSRAQAPMDITAAIDVNRFPGLQVADEFESGGLQGNAFRGDHVFVTLRAFSFAVNHRANTAGITKADNALARQHHYHRIGTFDSLVRFGNRGENLVRGQVQATATRELVGKDI